jgi:hypothetical protein
MQPILMIECPRQLFPFAREIVASAVRNGGFPPLLADSVDFVGLYQQRLPQTPPAPAPTEAGDQVARASRAWLKFRKGAGGQRPTSVAGACRGHSGDSVIETAPHGAASPGCRDGAGLPGAGAERRNGRQHALCGGGVTMVLLSSSPGSKLTTLLSVAGPPGRRYRLRVSVWGWPPPPTASSMRSAATTAAALSIP